MTRFKLLKQLFVKLHIGGKCSKSHMAALKASMDKLPIEIVTFIFIQAVYDPQLRPLLLKLLLTSRWVYNTLQPLLYHTINLKTEHQAQRFLRTIQYDQLNRRKRITGIGIGNGYSGGGLCGMVVNFDVPLVGVPPQAWPGRQQAEFCLPYYAALDKKGPQLKTVSAILSILLKETATIVRREPEAKEKEKEKEEEKGKGKGKEKEHALLQLDGRRDENPQIAVDPASQENQEGQSNEEGKDQQHGITDDHDSTTMILNGPLGPLRLTKDTTRTLIVTPLAQKLRSTNVNALPFTLPPKHAHSATNPNITIQPSLRLPADVTLSGIGILSFKQWDFRHVERLRFTSIMISEILRIEELVALPRLQYLSVPLYKGTFEGAKKLLTSETLRRLVIFTIFNSTSAMNAGGTLNSGTMTNANGWVQNQQHQNLSPTTYTHTSAHMSDPPVITISTGSTTTIISPPTPIAGVGSLSDADPTDLILTPVTPVLPVAPVTPFATASGSSSGSTNTHDGSSSTSEASPAPLQATTSIGPVSSRNRNLLSPLAPLTPLTTLSTNHANANAASSSPNSPINPTSPMSPASPTSLAMPLSPGGFSTFSTTSNVNLGALGEIDDDRLVLYHLRDMVKLHHLTSDEFWEQVEYRAICCTSRFLSEA